MRRLEPAVELLAHHVAVGAGGCVVGQIGPPLCIGESIRADADGDSDDHPEQDALNRAKIHLCFRSLIMGRLSPGKNGLLERGGLSYFCLADVLVSSAR